MIHALFERQKLLDSSPFENLNGNESRGRASIFERHAGSVRFAGEPEPGPNGGETRVCISSDRHRSAPDLPEQRARVDKSSGREGPIEAWYDCRASFGFGASWPRIGTNDRTSGGPRQIPGFEETGFINSVRDRASK